MPIVVAGAVDTEAIEPGAIYSEESCIAEADNTITLSGTSYQDIPGMTISLNLARPATVLQLALVHFIRSGFERISFRPLCDNQAKAGISRAPRYYSWQGAFLVALWPGLSPGNHVFKIQGANIIVYEPNATTATLKNRQHCLIVMRI